MESNWRNFYLLVLAVGVFLLAAPIYVPLGADATTVDRTSAPYHGTPADRNETIGKPVVPYEDLSPAAQRAVDRIVDGTYDGYGEYHPRADNPITDREPLFVERDGTVYHVRRDDGTHFSQEAGYVIDGLLVAAAGLFPTAIGGVGYLWCRWKES